MFLDRRKGDRRVGGKKYDNTEHRAGNSDHNLRKWNCGILHQTTVHMGEIERWLLDNAKSRWGGVGLDSFDEALSSKVLKIMIESQYDKNAFIEHFSL